MDSIDWFGLSINPPKAGRDIWWWRHARAWCVYDRSRPDPPTDIYRIPLLNHRTTLLRPSMRLLLSAAAAAALLAGLQGAVAQEVSPKPTLEDCKLALQSLSTPPYTTSLPFLAAATGGCV